MLVRVGQILAVNKDGAIMRQGEELVRNKLIIVKRQRG